MIEGYEYDDTRIIFRFKDGEEKDYSNQIISPFDLNVLKERSDSGRGLDECLKEIDSRKAT